jgi:hypothetical protein
MDLFEIHNISFTISTPLLSWGGIILVRSAELLPYPFWSISVASEYDAKVIGELPCSEPMLDCTYLVDWQPINPPSIRRLDYT